MLHARQLCKIFRTEDIETHALQNVNLDVERGEFVAVMGPSGCGKSTLLHLLGLLDSPTSGYYQFDGREVAHMEERDRAGIRKGAIGFVFQTFNLVEEMTVSQNVELPLMYLGVTKVERKRMVQEVLCRTGLTPRSGHYPCQLSGGQQQRVAVARAVVAPPKLILADEPTGNLDSKHSLEIMNLLVELNQYNTTIVMVTHSHFNANFASRIINLFDGKVVIGFRSTMGVE